MDKKEPVGYNVESSMQVGQNILHVLDQIKFTAITAEQRKQVAAYLQLMEVVDTIAQGKLVLVDIDYLEKNIPKTN